MLLLFLIGSGATLTPPADLPFQGDAYYYDSAGGAGSISGGAVQPGPNQGSPTGTVQGGMVQPSPNQSSPTGSVSGGTILPPEIVL